MNAKVAPRGGRHPAMLLAAVVPLVALVQTILAILHHDGRFLQGYLLAFVFWLGFPLGSLFLLLLHAITGGAWGVALRPALARGAATVPLMALLFIPLACAVPEVYAWASRPESLVIDGINDKGAYLRWGSFVIRAVVYFAAWLWFTRALLKPSARLSWKHESARLEGAVGLTVLFFTASFAAVDWVMSLNPRWVSNIYGLIVLAGMTATALAWSFIASRPQDIDAAPGTRGDLGNMLLANVMLLAYFHFSQLIILWSGAKPRDMAWYAARYEGDWRWAAWGLVVLGFAVPFLALLFRRIKRNPKLIAWVAVLMLLVHGLHVVWLAVPDFGGRALRWEDLWLWFALGVAWLLASRWEWRRGTGEGVPPPAGQAWDDTGRPA